MEIILEAGITKYQCSKLDLRDKSMEIILEAGITNSFFFRATRKAVIDCHDGSRALLRYATSMKRK